MKDPFDIIDRDRIDRVTIIDGQKHQELLQQEIDRLTENGK